MKEKLQTYGKAMLVPITLVALGGLLLGLGGALTNETTITALGMNWATYNGSLGFIIFTVIKTLGEVIFKNLSILYAIGVAFSLAKKEKGWAAFSSAVAFLAMLATMQALLSAQGLSAANTSVKALIEAGVNPLDAAKKSALYTTELGYFINRTGVFGGIALGSLVAYLHNKFYNTKLPLALSFFSGTRTVPIVSLLAGAGMGLFFFISWPLIGMIFSNFAQFVYDTGLFGTFVYRSVVEALVPFGLHPLLSLPMRWTELGGSQVVDGVLVQGNAAIQLAQLASPEQGKLLVRAFMGASGIINFAIFPGAAYAMYKTAKKENKKKVAGLLIPAIISTTVFGITEPILFTFLFVAPWMYFLVYVPLAGLAEVLSEFFQVSIYQGNIKDWIPLILRPEKLNVVPYLFLMPLFFFVSYWLFKKLILWKNVQTPGREDDIEDQDEIKLYSKADYNQKIEDVKNRKELPLGNRIVEALGGRENIEEVDNCISRLRVIVKNPELVAKDDVWKKECEAMGIIRMNKGIQIIYGAHVASVAVEVKEAMEI